MIERLSSWTSSISIDDDDDDDDPRRWIEKNEIGAVEQVAMRERLAVQQWQSIFASAHFNITEVCQCLLACILCPLVGFAATAAGDFENVHVNLKTPFAVCCRTNLLRLKPNREPLKIQRLDSFCRVVYPFSAAQVRITGEAGPIKSAPLV